MGIPGFLGNAWRRTLSGCLPLAALFLTPLPAEATGTAAEAETDAELRPTPVAGPEPALREMIGFNAGVGLGTFFLGGKIRHDLMFLNLHYGRLFERRFLEGSPWAGRLMLMGEGTIAREYRPEDSWVISLAPVVRYHFDRPGRWIPFAEGGYGLTWTDIRRPDLGGDLQFNGHLGGGFYWFATPQVAYTIQYRFVHYSNAGMRSPNSGVNLNTGLVGVSYFY